MSRISAYHTQLSGDPRLTEPTCVLGRRRAPCIHCRWSAVGERRFGLGFACTDPNCSYGQAGVSKCCCSWEREPGIDRAGAAMKEDPEPPLSGPGVEGHTPVVRGRSLELR